MKKQMFMTLRVRELLKFFIPFLWTKSLSSLLLHKGDFLWFSQNCLTHGVVNDDWTKIRQNNFLHGVVHTYKHLQTANWQTAVSGIDTVGPLRLSCKRDIYTWVFVSTHASVVSNKHNFRADQKKLDHLLPGNLFYFHIYMWNVCNFTWVCCY